MRIITISRQFGSGGREFGKRLADILGFDYYDREIISDKKWGAPASYDLTINTTDWEIKALAQAVAEFAICRFGGNHANPVV